MGVVYRALDRRRLEAQDPDPYVAIKILSDEFRRHPKALIALQREARKSQTLAHPNVITVYDFERDGTTVYMTMELLDGKPLNHVIAASEPYGLPPKEALPIVRGMAAALAYAHQKGFVHADFKPGNVFLTSRNDVKVLDFGIARAVPNALQPNHDHFDAAELGAMTPSYASPEMLRGEAPDPADDVFGLAVVAYELLTGRHPFDRLPADRARRSGKKAPAISGLSRRQRAALARALSFERKARHADAGAFLKDLDGAGPLRKTAYAATLVLLAGIAAYGLYESNQIRPDVPWESLTITEQSAFTGLIEEGSRALDFADRGVGSEALNDAFDRFAGAYVIHRNNPDAIRGLEGVAERFLDLMSAADARDRQNIVRKLYCQDYLRSYRRVLTACDEVFGPRQCAVAQMQCASAEGDR
jgi:serine/threonine protein kinase